MYAEDSYIFCGKETETVEQNGKGISLIFFLLKVALHDMLFEYLVGCLIVF